MKPQKTKKTSIEFLNFVELSLLDLFRTLPFQPVKSTKLIFLFGEKTVFGHWRLQWGLEYQIHWKTEYVLSSDFQWFGFGMVSHN